jgi:hypothetical protein
VFPHFVHCKPPFIACMYEPHFSQNFIISHQTARLEIQSTLSVRDEGALWSSDGFDSSDFFHECLCFFTEGQGIRFSFAEDTVVAFDLLLDGHESVITSR